jgi:hypothetical protein
MVQFRETRFDLCKSPFFPFVDFTGWHEDIGKFTEAFVS